MRTAYKPDSVQRLNLLDDHSSKVCITTDPIAAYPNLTPKQSRRLFKLSYRFLFGIAPGGACHAGLVTKTPVGSYPTLSPLPEKKRAVYFLLRFPSGYPARALPGTAALRSPDFPRVHSRPSSHPQGMGLL